MSELIIQPAQAIPRLDIEAARAHFAHFNEFKRAILKPDIDYGKVPGIDKPFLKQPGAQKLAKAFSLTFSIQQSNREVDIKSGFVCYEYVATCYYNGMAVAQGVGACNTFEDKYAYTAWTDAPEPDVQTKRELIAQGIGKMKPGYQGSAPRWQQRTRKNPADAIALQNTVAKMASKRAIVAAVLNSTGGGEFFTQDIEDMPEVISVGEQLSQAKAAILHTVKTLVITEKELAEVWRALPSMQKEDWLISSVRTRRQQIAAQKGEDVQ